MNRLLSLALAVATFGSGCTDSTRARPGPSPLVDQAPQASAAVAVDVPVKGHCTTTFSFVPVEQAGTCAIFAQVPSAFIAIAGDCQLSHLGKSTLRAVQQVVFAVDSAGAPVVVNGQPVIVGLRNCGVFVAANGDELRHTTEGPVTAGDMPGTVNFGGDIAFVGGTGRFAGRTGSATFDGSASLLSSTGEFALEGNLGR